MGRALLHPCPLSLLSLSPVLLLCLSAAPSAVCCWCVLCLTEGSVLTGVQGSVGRAGILPLSLLWHLDVLG